MAALHELIGKIENPELRAQIQAAVDKLAKQKKFGLVFEEHLPECTPLYDIPVKKGAKVALKAGKVSDYYTVLKIEDGTATCLNKDKNYTASFPVDALVPVAEFGEPIYPYLKPIDTVCNAPESDLWHTLIEADNYHALQFLEYLYAGKVDCIYIDPPYNTGARDWKYNNDYVDNNDIYRHSKWLSFMSKRLKLARKLLNPQSGVLIVTIDEHEVHHLRTLMEEIIPEAHIQMATIVINAKGVAQGHLARVEEYALYAFMPKANVPTYADDLLSQTELSAMVESPRWERLLRGGNNSRREDRPTMFYPIFIDPDKKKVTGIGEVLPLEEMPDLSHCEDRTVAWPIRSDGSLGYWQLQPATFLELFEKGFIKLGTYDKTRKTWTLLYLNRGTRKRIDEGEIIITGRDEITGTVSVKFARPEAKMYNIKTVWFRKLHDSGVYGSTLLANIIGREVKFDFPKSVYSTKDTIANIVRNNTSALILDFFAGSGTTLNAVNLLNAEDNGHRRCILVTNNECSDADSNVLLSKGVFPGQTEWEKSGVCRSITWPRTKNSILGYRQNGEELHGEYYTSILKKVEIKRHVTQIDYIDVSKESSIALKKRIITMLSNGKIYSPKIVAEDGYYISDDKSAPIAVLFDKNTLSEWYSNLCEQNWITDIFVIIKDQKLYTQIKKNLLLLMEPFYVDEKVKMAMSDGFKTNAIFFKLGFLDKTKVSLGRQFKEMLPTLWMKAGAHGPCPSIDEGVPAMLILPENHMAILNDENRFEEFATQLKDHSEIDVVYLVTDYEYSFTAMTAALKDKKTYQLYRDYLDNFRINAGRNSR